MSGRPPDQRRLSSFAVVILLLFALVIYLVVAVPTIDGTADEVDRSTIEDQGLGGQLDLILDASLLAVPTILALGLVLYVYAVVAGAGSYRGGGPR